MTLFPTSTDTIKNTNYGIVLKALCHACDVCNKSSESELCNQDGVYGDVYKSIGELLDTMFNPNIAQRALNSTTWCVSDFEGQILPAIEEAIESYLIDYGQESLRLLEEGDIEFNNRKYLVDDSDNVIYNPWLDASGRFDCEPEKDYAEAFEKWKWEVITSERV